MVESVPNRLTVTLPSDREIVLKRVFNASARLVFEAFTKPELVKRWWGLKHQTMSVCEIDLRPGGAWRFVLLEQSGVEFGFRGVYREINAPEQLVHTYIFEPMPQHDALVTVTFEEINGKTLITESILHKTKEARDGHVQSGMEAGAAESLERLDEVLAGMN
jgi:uncharacterized protein YndB with AHSA1/START domain